MSPPRSAVIIRWPAVFDVALEIDPKRVAKEETVGIVGLRLVKMGGKFVDWKPDLNRRPAIARFEFANRASRDWFVAEAIEIPGVSIAR